jgi:hypothetical protein
MAMHGAAALSLFVLAAAGGLLPLALRDGRCISESLRRITLAVGSCFSGGLLVGASLLHLLPAASRLDAASADGGGGAGGREEDEPFSLYGGGGAGGDEGEEKDPYPFSFLLCGSAFLLLMALDRAARLACSADAASDQLESGEAGSGEGGSADGVGGEPRASHFAPSGSSGRGRGGHRSKVGAGGGSRSGEGDEAGSGGEDYGNGGCEGDEGESGNGCGEGGERRARAAEGVSLVSAGAAFGAFSFHAVMEGVAMGVVDDATSLFAAVGENAD